MIQTWKKTVGICSLLQVANKFGDCVKQIINNREVGDGESTLAKNIQTCVENMRNTEGLPQPPRKTKVQKGTKQVGVLQSEYHPPLLNKTEQETTKELMKTMHQENEIITEEEVLPHFEKCYTLLRQDLLMLYKQVEEDESEPDEPAGPAVKGVKTEWPCLFTTWGLDSHYRRLTGKDIDGPMDKFITEQLEVFSNFLITASPKYVENLALRVALETKYPEEMKRPEKVLLMAVMMLANHFNEDHDKLIIPVEVSFFPI